MKLTDDTRVVAYEWTYKTYDERMVTTLCVYAIEDDKRSAEYLLDEAVKHHEGENVRIMTFAEYDERDRELTLAREVREVDEETFHEMLNVLPPLKWVDRKCEKLGARVNEFCMSEFDHSHYTQQYARVFVGDETRYYSATVDYFDESTWIHNRL